METRVHYFCFGVDEDTKDEMNYFPSSLPKISYVSDTIKKAGFKLNIVSSCSIKHNGIFFGRSSTIDELEKHIFFTSFRTSNKLINKVSVFFGFVQLILYCLFYVKKNEPILIYHSLYYLKPMKFLQMIKRVQFSLEVEEIYSSLSDKNKQFYQSEIDFINSANAYLLVNDLIDEKIDRGNKPAIISYGSYNIPPEIPFEQFSYKGKINVVYAGVIENIRKAAFMAVDSACFLNNDYRIHILGFGNEKDIGHLMEKISDVNSICGEERVIFHGAKSGEEYYRFLQSCDIALSCHTYDENMRESADYSFPSKILTYLANNLRVVSSNIRAVKNSRISNYIAFYDDNSSECIAKKIKSIDFTENFDGRNLLKGLDNEFTLNIKKLLRGK